MSDVISYVKKLDIDEYDRYEKCDDERFDVNVWYIFHSVTYLYNTNDNLEKVRIYIRIGIKNKNLIIIVRSFHEDD